MFNSLMTRPTPTSTLFPYTTLFRSPESRRGRPPTFHHEDHCMTIEQLLRAAGRAGVAHNRSEEHTSELQSRFDLVCRLLLEKKKSASHSFRCGAAVSASMVPAE